MHVGVQKGVSWGAGSSPLVLTCGCDRSLRSAKKSRARQDWPWRWLKAALLVSLVVAGGFLSWRCLQNEDGVTEVLARHGDNLRDTFIEVPCSEDYDSHKRFEGIWGGLSKAG